MNKLRLVWYGFRSVVFYALMFLTICLWLPATVLVFRFLPLKQRYRATTAWGRLVIVLLRLLCGVRYRVEGKENIPDSPCMIMANHQSAWETLFLPGLFVPQTWILKKELLKLPVMGAVLASLEPIAIDRSKKVGAMQEVMEQGQARLQQGYWIVVFPEGTRVAPFAQRSFQAGAGRLAVATGTPVLPIAHNAGLFWPKNQLIKRPGLITLRIGPLIEASDDAKALTEAARQWIYANKEQLEQQA